MKPHRSHKAAIAAFAALTLLSAANAATVLVTDGTNNDFGDAGGVAIDFDATTGLAADWVADLSTSQTYFIDSLTLFRATNEASTGTVYLGVYTSIGASPGKTLGGFQGVSTNTINLSTLGQNAPFTFTFSGFSVTPQQNPASGGDIRYFVFQTGTTALANIDLSVRVPIRRIDDNTTPAGFSHQLAAVLQRGHPTEFLRTGRAPEYSATITPIPEPSALALLGIAGAVIAARRRR